MCYPRKTLANPPVEVNNPSSILPAHMQVSQQQRKRENSICIRNVATETPHQTLRTIR